MSSPLGAPRPFLLGLCAALALALGSPTAALAQAEPLPAEPATELPSLAPVLERVTPAVVNIAVVSEMPEVSNPLLWMPLGLQGISDRLNL